MHFVIQKESTTGTDVQKSIQVPGDNNVPVRMELPFDFVLVVSQDIAKDWHRGDRAVVDFYRMKNLQVILKYKYRLRNGFSRLRFLAAP